MMKDNQKTRQDSSDPNEEKSRGDIVTEENQIPEQPVHPEKKIPKGIARVGNTGTGTDEQESSGDGRSRR